MLELESVGLMTNQSCMQHPGDRAAQLTWCAGWHQLQDLPGHAGGGRLLLPQHGPHPWRTSSLQSHSNRCIQHGRPGLVEWGTLCWGLRRLLAAGSGGLLPLLPACSGCAPLALLEGDPPSWVLLPAQARGCLSVPSMCSQDRWRVYAGKLMQALSSEPKLDSAYLPHEEYAVPVQHTQAWAHLSGHGSAGPCVPGGSCAFWALFSLPLAAAWWCLLGLLMAAGAGAIMSCSTPEPCLWLECEGLEALQDIQITCASCRGKHLVS